MIHLHTLGAVNLRRDGAELRSVLSQPRRLALLVYLAAARPRGFHSRDRLLALFWPDSDEDRARNALRQAVHQLRKSLGEDAIVGRGDREIGLDPTKVWCDAAALDEAVAAGRFEQTIELYRGDFLAGFFVEEAPEIERFIEDERARLRRLVIDSAWRLANQAEGRNDLAGAAAWGRQAVALEPLDEPAFRRLAELLDRAGDRVDAIRMFEDLTKRLEAELGITPDDSTVELMDRLRRRGSERPPVLESAPSHTMVETPRPDAARDADVDGHGSPATSADSPPQGSRLPFGRPARPWRSAAVTAVIALAAILGFVAARSRAHRSAPAASSEVALAVLPFVNMTGDPSNEYFSDGMAEEVAYALSRLPGLRVVGRTSAFSFKGTHASVDSIGRALHASHIVDGSIRATGGRFRVVAQLIDASSGYHVWSDTWDGEMRDVFSVQAEIAQAVVRELQPRLVGASSSGESERETDDPDAYADVIRGFQALYRGQPIDYSVADTFFTRALRRDPAYARAWAGLAGVQLGDAYRGVVPRAEGYVRARQSALRALDIDPSLAVAHATLGRIALDSEWDFATADEYYRRAIELSPGTETWYRQRGVMLALLGRTDEAIALARKAVEIDPLATGAYRNLGSTYFRARQYDSAIEANRNALVLAPEHQVALMNLAVAMSMLDRHDEAVALARRSLARDPEEPIMLGLAGFIYARAGDAETARDIVGRLKSKPLSSPYLRGLVTAALGDHDAAFLHLEEAFRARDPQLVEVNVFPAFDDMRSDTRMVDLIARVGFPTVTPARATSSSSPDNRSESRRTPATIDR